MSTATPDRADLLDAIAAQLSSPRRARPFEEKDSLAALLDTSKSARHYWRSAAGIQVDGHLELRPDLLIHDAELGTLGLLHLVPKADKRKLAAWFRERIEDGVYLRHLLVSQTRREGSPRPPIACTVEVVFVLPDPGTEAGRLAGEVMQAMMREGTFLHGVGVNFWRSPIADEAHVRQALAWLLDRTAHCLRGWSSEEWQPAATAKPLGRFHSVSMKNFRACRERTLALEGDALLHLIHGHNGSGKSSVVDAIELLVCGKLERLGKSADHQAILRNRQTPNVEAEITVTYEKGSGNGKLTSLSGKVTPDGIARPLRGNLNANGFRMHQRLADDLASGSPSDLATVFLGAFFGDQSEAIAARQRAHAELDSRWKALPPPRRAASSSLPPNQTTRPPTPRPATSKSSPRSTGWAKHGSRGKRCSIAGASARTGGRQSGRGWRKSRRCALRSAALSASMKSLPARQISTRGSTACAPAWPA